MTLEDGLADNQSLLVNLQSPDGGSYTVIGKNGEGRKCKTWVYDIRMIWFGSPGDANRKSVMAAAPRRRGSLNRRRAAAPCVNQTVQPFRLFFRTPQFGVDGIAAQPIPWNHRFKSNPKSIITHLLPRFQIELGPRRVSLARHLWLTAKLGEIIVLNNAFSTQTHLNPARVIRGFSTHQRRGHKNNPNRN